MSHTKDELLHLEAYARQAGWRDLDQMLYYERLAAESYLIQVQELPSPPHELEKMDSRELYDDLAGVY